MSKDLTSMKHKISTRIINGEPVKDNERYENLTSKSSLCPYIVEDHFKTKKLNNVSKVNNIIEDEDIIKDESKSKDVTKDVSKDLPEDVSKVVSKDEFKLRDVS